MCNISIKNLYMVMENYFLKTHREVIFGFNQAKKQFQLLPLLLFPYFRGNGLIERMKEEAE